MCHRVQQGLSLFSHFLYCFLISDSFVCRLYFEVLSIASPDDHDDVVGSSTCDFSLCLIYIRLVSLHPNCLIHSSTRGPDIRPASSEFRLVSALSDLLFERNVNKRKSAQSITDIQTLAPGKDTALRPVFGSVF